MRIFIDIWHKPLVMETPAQDASLSLILYAPELLDHALFHLWILLHLASIVSRNIAAPITYTEYLIRKTEVHLGNERLAQAREGWGCKRLGSELGR